MTNQKAFLLVLNGGGSGLAVITRGDTAEFCLLPEGQAKPETAVILGTCPIEHLAAAAKQMAEAMDPTLDRLRAYIRRSCEESGYDEQECDELLRQIEAGEVDAEA